MSENDKLFSVHVDLNDNCEFKRAFPSILLLKWLNRGAGGKPGVFWGVSFFSNGWYLCLDVTCEEIYAIWHTLVIQQ